MTARQMVQVLEGRGISRDQMFVFTTIRNPWARMVSQWFHAKRTEVSIFYELANTVHTLEEFVTSPKVRKAYRDRHSYTAFCCGEGGEPLVDLTIRSEDIDDTMPHLLRILGIAAEHEVPDANRSDHAPYRRYYSDRAKAAVADLLWDDVEVGGYEF
jgi:hypothetical protein